MKNTLLYDKNTFCKIRNKNPEYLPCNFLMAAVNFSYFQRSSRELYHGVKLKLKTKSSTLIMYWTLFAILVNSEINYLELQSLLITSLTKNECTNYTCNCVFLILFSIRNILFVYWFYFYLSVTIFSAYKTSLKVLWFVNVFMKIFTYCLKN